LAHVFLWEYIDKRLKLAQLLGQRGVFLTCESTVFVNGLIAPIAELRSMKTWGHNSW
jgi:hypothetical protein